MFERFTKLARRALVAAQTSAQQFGDPRIGTEHVLLGLVLVEGMAARVLGAAGIDEGVVRDGIVRRRSPAIDDADALRTIGIDLTEVRASVEAAFGEGALERPRGRGRRRDAPPFDPETKRALELSLREALTLKHSYIGTEHLLLAIVRLGHGEAYEILRDRIGDPNELRPKVMEALRQAS